MEESEGKAKDLQSDDKATMILLIARLQYMQVGFLQCVVICCSVFQHPIPHTNLENEDAAVGMFWSVLQSGAQCCSILQCIPTPNMSHSHTLRQRRRGH